MSGGGGKYLSGDDISKLRREAIESVIAEGEEARINQLLERQLAQVDERDVAEVRRKLDLIQEVIEDLLEDHVDLVFGGSIAKHTYVDGLSDVDSLVVIRPDLINVESPGQLVTDFATALRERLGPVVETVTGGGLAVTVRFRDGIAVDVLPAIRRGNHVAISSSDGKSWSEIRPAGFARKLQTVNEATGGRLYKTIKLAKALMTGFPPGRELTGYHVESLAIDAFRSYRGPRSFRQMLRHLLDHSSRGVLAPIKDSTGQSIHVDEYLGGARSMPRRLRADSLGKLARRVEAASTADQWRRLLDETEL
jgi:hypothetical protein